MYVQAYGGSDTVGTGEEDSPVATLGRALAVAKEKYNENPDKYPKTEIIVGDGTYDVNGTIYINENYCKFGEGGLDIKAQDGAKPVFSGGVSYGINEAKKVEDENILARLHSESAKDNLYELDLTSKIKLSAIPAVSYPGSYNLNSMLSSVGLENPPVSTCDAIFDNELMTVARYPNSGYANMGTIIDEGINGQHMLAEFDGTENDLELTKENLLKGFEFKTDYEKLSSWKTADQALIFGYFIYNWATQTVPLKEINTENGTIRSKYPSYYGVSEGARYYVYNLLEEIDMPGEYFIDRKTGKMYFYMPENVTDESTIRITRNDNSSLINIGNIENVTIEGITITGSMSTGVRLEGNNNVIKNCEVSNTGSYGIQVRGTNNTVDSCYIHDTNVGVLLEGGVTDTLTPGNNVVTNCEITRFSRTNKTYTPAVSIYGVGNKVTHNEIHNGEHTALTYSGQKHEISYNEVYDVCKEVDDAGALYVGRTWTNRGNKIISNYFHDIQSNIDVNVPISALYFDDHFAGAYVEGNVIANVGGYGIHGNGGREHTITNNVFVNCLDYSTYMRDSGLDKTYETHISGLNKVPYTSEIWRKEFPELYNILNNAPKYPVDHIYTKNLAVNCGEGHFYGNLGKAYAKDISDNYVTDTDPGFKDMENKNYAITADTLSEHIPGFKTIEFEKMGRQ